MSEATARTIDEPGVAMVAPASAGTLPAHLQQALELRKLSNQVAGKIAELNWGQKLDLMTRRAVADWARTYAIDPTTEIHVLGGNIYLNAAYYLRRLAQLIERGIVEYAYADHVEDDARLKELKEEGIGESNRRLRERIKHQVPDKAASAVVFRVKLRSMDREVVGVKWCGNGVNKNDPVGDAKPVETSESRAARRAMRQIVTHMPNAIELLEVEESAQEMSERIASANADFDRREAQIAGRPKQMPPRVDPDDPYRVKSIALPDAVLHESQIDEPLVETDERELFEQ